MRESGSRYLCSSASLSLIGNTVLIFKYQRRTENYLYWPRAAPPRGQGELPEVTTLSVSLNIRRRAFRALSALAPSSEKPPRNESEVEEEANAQAEAQKKKDETEVQVNLYTRGSHRSRSKESQRPGTLLDNVGLHVYCPELVSVDLEHLPPF